MKRMLAVLVCLVGVLSWVGCRQSEKSPEVSESLQESGQIEATAQTTCPIMGGKINESLYVDYDGKRVYVCCQVCIGKVKEDPAKYVKKLEAEGVTLEKVD